MSSSQRCGFTLAEMKPTHAAGARHRYVYLRIYRLRTTKKALSDDVCILVVRLSADFAKTGSGQTRNGKPG
jgi:hypothetical protein